MNEVETKKVLLTLTGMWSDEVIDEPKVAAYQMALGPYSYEQVMTAAAKHMQSSKWFPKAAELIELIPVPPAITPGEAWSMVQKQINRHGFNGWDNVLFDDPDVADAVLAIGWRRICLDETKYVIPEFERALKAAQLRREKESIGVPQVPAPGFLPELDASR